MKHRSVFPLNMTLFPGGRLPLQIFETRYIDMVKGCMKAEQGFTVVSIKAGQETGKRPEIYDVGTYADIVDWELLPSGLLGITVEGRHRVKLSDICEQKDKLLTATIETIDAEKNASVPDGYKHLVDTLKSIKSNPVIQNLNLNIDYNSASDVSCRLSELLPFNIEDKQSLLELHDPLERLARVQAILDIMGSDFNIP
ncbi:MAG: LON peptidase substrate-binding domain-containing protein [Gammaproteobacteria bacterium]|nr:LON peptidase substrate-binding domain-containing protein [Gammaproteobacteria bacterium]